MIRNYIQNIKVAKEKCQLKKLANNNNTWILKKGVLINRSGELMMESNYMKISEALSITAGCSHGSKGSFGDVLHVSYPNRARKNQPRDLPWIVA